MLVGPEEVRKIAPLLRTDDIEGALWLPGDGNSTLLFLCSLFSSFFFTLLKCFPSFLFLFFFVFLYFLCLHVGSAGPSDVCNALAKGARMRGMEIFEGIRVSKVNTEFIGRQEQYVINFTLLRTLERGLLFLFLVFILIPSLLFLFFGFFLLFFSFSVSISCYLCSCSPSLSSYPFFLYIFSFSKKV